MASRISSSGTSSDTRDSQDRTKSSRVHGQLRGEEGSGPGRKSQHAERAAHGGGASTPAERLIRLEAIMRGENPLDRNRALLAFIDQLGPGDFEAAVAQFRSLGITDSRYGEYALLLSSWARMDPLAALAYAKANTKGRFATSTILTSWASADPQAAIRWAEENHEGESANPYLAGIIRGIAGSDPVRATQLLTGMPWSQERGEALDAMMPHLLTQGSAATRAWIAALTDDSLRSGAMMRAAPALAVTDPAGTAAWLVANPSEATQRRMDDVYAVWAEQDQQAAQNAFAALPSGENRSNALRGLINSMATTNPQAAVEMMNRFPNDVTDRAVRQFVWHSFGNDPSIAVDQIYRIADENQRNQMYGRMVGSWLQQNAAAATAWMQTHPLPAAVQEQLNKPH